MYTLGWDSQVCWADKRGVTGLEGSGVCWMRPVQIRAAPGTWHLTEIPLLEPSRKGTTRYMQQNDARSPALPQSQRCASLGHTPSLTRSTTEVPLTISIVSSSVRNGRTAGNELYWGIAGKRRLHTLLPFSVPNSEHRVPLRDELFA